MAVNNFLPLLYSPTPNTKPLVNTRLTGELWTNFADNQIGLIDAARASQPLIAVRYFSALTAYVGGDFVVQAGKIYVAKAAVPVGAFNATQWTALGTAADTAALYVALTGSTMTGPLILSADPTAALGAASKQYVDAVRTLTGNYLPLAGGTLTGALTGTTASFSGVLLAADPTASNGAATKSYVDAKFGGNYLPISGGTLTGGVSGPAGTFAALAATGGSSIVQAVAGGQGYLTLASPGGGSWMGYLMYSTTNNHVSLVNATGGGTLDLYPDNSMVASGSFQTQGVLKAQANVQVRSSDNNACMYLYDTSSNPRGQFQYFGASGQLQITLSPQNNWLALTSNTAFNVSASTAIKPGGGSWTAASDERIKNVHGDYSLGLEEVVQLRPVVYTYKGNDAAPGELSLHTNVLETEFIGFVAQELETVFPGMVTQGEGFVDGEPVTDLRNVDVSTLIYALVNAVKTMAARIEALEANQPVKT